MADFFEVKLNINGKQTIVKMEKGLSFSNKGGTYTVGDNGSIMMNGKKVDSINMTNYQFGVFKAVANNNDDGNKNEIVLSAKDIEQANKKGEKLNQDLSEFLPQGYKIEKESSSNNSLKLYATNGKESQSAELKFSAPSDAKPLAGADADLVKKYAKEFKNMPAKDIAFALHKQISGPSINAKTLAMFDAIPDDKLGEVMAKYNSIGDFHGLLYEIFGDNTVEAGHHNPSYNTGDFVEKYDTLLYSMNDEWGLDYKELKARIERTLDVVGNGKSTGDADNIKELLKSADKKQKFDEDTICKIENSFAAILGRSPEYKKEGVLGMDFLQHWKRVDKTNAYSEMTYNRVEEN